MRARVGQARRTWMRAVASGETLGGKLQDHRVDGQ
jgi:hypothetical protein